MVSDLNVVTSMCGCGALCVFVVAVASSVVMFVFAFCLFGILCVYIYNLVFTITFLSSALTPPRLFFGFAFPPFAYAFELVW